MRSKSSIYLFHGISQYHTMSCARDSPRKKVSHCELHLAATMANKQLLVRIVVLKATVQRQVAGCRAVRPLAQLGSTRIISELSGDQDSAEMITR